MYIFVQASAWDRDAIENPESLPLPSQRHRDVYKQREQEMRDAYRLKNVDAYLDEVRLLFSTSSSLLFLLRH